MKRLQVFLVVLLVALGACNERLDTPTKPGLPGIQNATVVLPAGSVNALADAIAAAGEHGKVVVAAGMHTEDAQVVINSTVTITGEPGAILEVATTPDPNGVSAESALLVRDASHVRISGLEIRGAGGAGNFGITLLRADHAQVTGNVISNHVTGVSVFLSDHTVISDNTVTSSAAYGIVIVSGSHTSVNDNHVEGAGFFGIWYCGENGRASGNTTLNCFVGAILCKVPAGSFEIDGEFYGSELPGQNWVVRNNVSSNNFTVGHLVIDDANNNLLINNTGSNNGTYDIELTGDTLRFGFLTPRSYENRVVIGPGNESLTVKDCGEDNTIIGTATIIDPNVEPCD